VASSLDFDKNESKHQSTMRRVMRLQYAHQRSDGHCPVPEMTVRMISERSNRIPDKVKRSFYKKRDFIITCQAQKLRLKSVSKQFVGQLRMGALLFKHSFLSYKRLSSKS
jgi:hypothetical protein